MDNLKPILLIEDDIVDALSAKRAFKEVNVQNDVVHVKNGEEALEFLQDDKNKKPCLLLLDINMPKMNGIEFLEERAKEEKLRLIPCIVLTTSNDDQDKYNSYNLNIAGYMIKPLEYENFVKVIHTIDMYWTLSKTVDL